MEGTVAPDFGTNATAAPPAGRPQPSGAVPPATDHPRAGQTVPVEFAGWLPAFLSFGNCGAHPQFAHVDEPPAGYQFVQSKPADIPLSPYSGVWGTPFRAAVRLGRRLHVAFVQPPTAVVRNLVTFGPVRCLTVLAAMLHLFFRLLAVGAKLRPTIRFVRTRHLRSQLMLPGNLRLAFLTSIPYTYGQCPWAIEIEDPVTLFYPWIHNGDTGQMDMRTCPYVKIVRTLLEAPKCRAVITHMRSTAAALPTLFNSEVIGRKTHYVPLGVKLPQRWQRQADDDLLHLFFTNSWHQHPDGFFLRGGLDVLEAFEILHERYPQLRLTLRSHLPELPERHHRIIERCWVRVVNRFVPSDFMQELHERSHIYLLPAARVHIVSILQAMSYGHAVIVSDGWGMDEYVTHGRNGLIVPCRGRRVSWMDEEQGILREDYEPMRKSHPQTVENLVAAISSLVEDHALRRRLGHTARHDVETRYNLQAWNQGLKTALDHALADG